MSVPWSDIAAHRERLVRIARRRCPSRDDAEDVVHEAMLRSATFEDLDEERLGQFLTAVTLRLCADVYRHADRDARAVRRLDAEDVPSPEAAAVAAAEAAELRELLDSLPTRQRAVLVDRAEGLSVTQISARHELTYKATESALSRARSTMRLALASAMSVLGAAVATVRRRPAVALALPLAAVAMVTTVHHSPELAAAPPVVVTPVTDAHVGAAERPHVTPVRTVALRRPAVRHAKPRTQVKAAQPERGMEDVVRVDPPGPGRTWGLQSDGETPEEMVDRCLNSENVLLTIDSSPGRGQPYVDVYCNPKRK